MRENENPRIIKRKRIINRGARKDGKGRLPIFLCALILSCGRASLSACNARADLYITDI
jgi:hypothetical protein